MNDNPQFGGQKRSYSEEDDDAGPQKKIAVIEAGQSTGKTEMKPDSYDS